MWRAVKQRRERYRQRQQQREREQDCGHDLSARVGDGAKAARVDRQRDGEHERGKDQIGAPGELAAGPQQAGARRDQDQRQRREDRVDYPAHAAAASFAMRAV